MNTAEPKKYQELLTRKASILVNNIAAIEKEARTVGGSEAVIASMCAPYYKTLGHIYADEFPLATALDESDLVVILDGPAVQRQHPRLSLISSYFTKVRTQVTRLTKELADISQTHTRLPQQVDLGLSAYGRGSLVLGFSLPNASGLDEDEAGQPSLFGEEDPVFQAAKEAIRTLGVVSYHVAANHSMEQIAQDVTDGRLRDIAMSALQDISPTGRLGVSSVTITGSKMPEKSASLTPATRKAITESLKSPVVGDEFAELTGYVREIDFDAKRFDLRQIEQGEYRSVRCVYSSYQDADAEKWVNRKISIYGKVERNKDGKPRLIDIQIVMLV